MRTERFLYVEYADGEREFYDLVNDPFELHNLAGGLTLLQLEELHAELLNLERCHDGLTCWSCDARIDAAGADQVAAPRTPPGALLRRRLSATDSLRAGRASARRLRRRTRLSGSLRAPD